MTGAARAGPRTSPLPRSRQGATNVDIAGALERLADLLEVQHGSPFRVHAYRSAADVVRRRPDSVAELAAREGMQGLEALPSIGKSIAAAILEMVRTGRIAMLDRLEGEVSPEDLLATVPGIGEELAGRIHHRLGVDTLEELELAAHDGRLETVPGFSRRRVQAIRDTLAGILARSTRRRARCIRLQEESASPGPALPAVDTILAVDEAYRSAAAEGRLHKIAPRRFNPTGEAWLPVLHMDRDGWSFTTLFSNTARAHELGMTADWVVSYFERDGHESQCTVVTERRGDLAGRRVIRGREDECRRHYARLHAA